MGQIIEEVKRNKDTLVDTATLSMKKVTFYAKAKQALTVAETAEAVNVSTRTVRSWIKGGLLPSFRIGGVVRVPSNAILPLLEGSN